MHGEGRCSIIFILLLHLLHKGNEDSLVLMAANASCVINQNPWGHLMTLRYLAGGGMQCKLATVSMVELERTQKHYVYIHEAENVCLCLCSSRSTEDRGISEHTNKNVESLEAFCDY